MTTAGSTTGKMLLYDSDAPACYANYLVRFRPRLDVDGRFIAYWMESRPYWDQIETGKVVSTIENFSASKYQNLCLSIPDPITQRAIADYLDRETARIDALIERIDRQVALLQERRRALITAAVTGELEIPGAARRVIWRRCRLDWLTSKERGVVNPTEISADTVFHYSIPALDETGDGRLERPDEIGSGKLLLSGGEVLINKLNPRLPRVLLAKAHDIPTLASTEFIALQPGPNIDERFLRYWLGSEPQRQMLNSTTMSVTHSQQRVRPEIITKSWLMIPSIDGQHAIADYLDRETAHIDALIERIDRQVALLQERRQALITAAITGELEIPGAAV